MLVVFVTGLYKKSFCLSRPTLIFGCFSLLTFTALASTLFSPYLIDSVQNFRKEYLPPLLLLLLATGLKQSQVDRVTFAQKIVWSLLAGFLVKTLLAVWDGGINHPFIFSPYSNMEFVEQNKGLPRYVSYYAVESVLYLTLAFAGFFYLTKNIFIRASLICISSTSFFIIYASGIRSAVVAATISCMYIALIKLKGTKHLLSLLIFFVILGSGAIMMSKDKIEVSRYISLIKAESYKKNDSIHSALSGRYFIWDGVSELIALRPMLGFGPGWQKLPDVARDTGLVAKWKSGSGVFSNLYKFDYFSMERGQANPHNLFLQITFEIGLLGLAAYIALFVSLMIHAFKSKRSDEPNSGLPITLWLGALSIPYALSYLIIDVTNALLLHNTMIVLMIVTILVDPAPTSRHSS